MELRDGLDFARGRSQGVVVTLRADGRPHLSNIAFHLGGDADPVARISTSDDRVKVRHLRRNPTASLYVAGDSFWSYVVLDGTAELSPVAAAPDDPTVDELVELYRSISGNEHPDWAEFREAMVAERRLVLGLHPTYAYGIGQR